MYGSGALRQTASGSLTPSGKVSSLLSCAWGVVCDPSLMRLKTPGNPGMLRSGAVAAILATVLLVQTWAWVGARVKGGLSAWVGAGSKVGFP